MSFFCSCSARLPQMPNSASLSRPENARTLTVPTSSKVSPRICVRREGFCASNASASMLCVLPPPIACVSLMTPVSDFPIKRLNTVWNRIFIPFVRKFSSKNASGSIFPSIRSLRFSTSSRAVSTNTFGRGLHSSATLFISSVLLQVNRSIHLIEYILMSFSPKATVF